MQITTNPLQLALNDLTKRRFTKQAMQQAHGNEMLEGLLTKGYANIVENTDVLEITVQGVKALLDFEGLFDNANT